MPPEPRSPRWWAEQLLSLGAITAWVVTMILLADRIQGVTP